MLSALFLLLYTKMDLTCSVQPNARQMLPRNDYFSPISTHTMGIVGLVWSFVFWRCHHNWSRPWRDINSLPFCGKRTWSCCMNEESEGQGSCLSHAPVYLKLSRAGQRDAREPVASKAGISGPNATPFRIDFEINLAMRVKLWRELITKRDACR